MDEKTDKQLLDYYNNNSKLLAKKFNKLGPREEDIKEIFSNIKRVNPRVLEIGCGNGRDAKGILKYTKNYTGIDFSKSMIEMASKFLPLAKFEVADMNTYTFPKKLDAIISFASLVHSNKDDVKSVLNKGYRSLNKGGIFYISLKYGEYEEKKYQDELGTRRFYYYTEKEFGSLIGKFKIVKESTKRKSNQKWLEVMLQK